MARVALALALAFGLVGCWTAPAPEPHAPAGSRSVNSRKSLEWPIEVFVGHGGVVVRLYEPLNPALVEGALGVFEGEFDPDATYDASVRLEHESVCDGVWRVHNPNPVPVSFTWTINGEGPRGRGEQGVGVVPAHGEAFFRTQPGHNVVRLFVAGRAQGAAPQDDLPCGREHGSFEWSPNLGAFRYDPPTPLDAEQAYTVVSTSRAETAAGASLGDPFVRVINRIPRDEAVRLVHDRLREQGIELAGIETTVRRAGTFWDVYVSRPPYDIDYSHCPNPELMDCRPMFTKQVPLSQAFRVDLSTGEVILFARGE